MKEVNIKLSIPIKSEYANKSITFKVESIEELEERLIKFFNENDMLEMIDSKTGLIRSMYKYVLDEKMYHRLNEIELKDTNNINLFAFVFGG